MQLPIGKESNFKGVIDILKDRAIYFDGPCGEVLRYDEVPQEYRTQHKETHHELVEYLVWSSFCTFTPFLKGKRRNMWNVQGKMFQLYFFLRQIRMNTSESFS